MQVTRLAHGGSSASPHLQVVVIIRPIITLLFIFVCIHLLLSLLIQSFVWPRAGTLFFWLVFPKRKYAGVSFALGQIFNFQLFFVWHEAFGDSHTNQFLVCIIVAIVDFLLQIFSFCNHRLYFSDVVCFVLSCLMQLSNQVILSVDTLLNLLDLVLDFLQLVLLRQVLLFSFTLLSILSECLELCFFTSLRLFFFLIDGSFFLVMLFLGFNDQIVNVELFQAQQVDGAFVLCPARGI